MTLFEDATKIYGPMSLHPQETAGGAADGSADGADGTDSAGPA